MAKRPRFVAAADTHTLPACWVGRPTLRGDAFYAFGRLVGHCLAKRLPLVLAGDILDVVRPDSETAKFLRKQVERMRKVGLPVYYVLGNHEKTSPPWFDAISDWPIHIHEKSVEINGVRVYGLDYVGFSELPEKLAAIPSGTQALVCHQAWLEFMGSERRNDGSLGMIPEVRLVLTGDFHKHKVLELAGASGQLMRVISPGSLVRTAIDEVTPRRFVEMNDDLTATSYKLPGRPYLEPPVIDSSERMDAFLADVRNQIAAAVEGAAVLPEELRKPLLRVAYRSDIPDAYRRLERVIGDSAFFFKKVVRPEAPQETAALEQSRAAVQLGLVGCLPQVVPDRESDLYRYTRELLEAVQGGEKPEVAIGKLRRRFFHDPAEDGKTAGDAAG